MLQTLEFQRQETLSPGNLATASGTGTGTTGTGTGARTPSAAATASTPSTGCGFGWGIGHAGDAAGEVLDVADDFLRERLHASHDRGGEVRAGQGGAA